MAEIYSRCIKTINRNTIEGFSLIVLFHILSLMLCTEKIPSMMLLLDFFDAFRDSRETR